MTYVLCLTIDEHGHGVTPLTLPGAALPFNLHLTCSEQIARWQESDESYRCRIAGQVADNILSLRRLGFSLRVSLCSVYNVTFCETCDVIHFISYRG